MADLIPGAFKMVKTFKDMCAMFGNLIRRLAYENVNATYCLVWPELSRMCFIKIFFFKKRKKRTKKGIKLEKNKKTIEELFENKESLSAILLSGDVDMFCTMESN